MGQKTWQKDIAFLSLKVNIYSREHSALFIWFDVFTWGRNCLVHRLSIVFIKINATGHKIKSICLGVLAWFLIWACFVVFCSLTSLLLHVTCKWNFASFMEKWERNFVPLWSTKVILCHSMSHRHSSTGFCKVLISVYSYRKISLLFPNAHCSQNRSFHFLSLLFDKSTDLTGLI